MSWPARDMFAVTADGTILINILALKEKRPPRLALQKGIFVGVALTEVESKLLQELLYDASSDAAARIARTKHVRSGGRRR